jgi:senataxin
VALRAPEKAEGRVWFLAPAGKLSSASQSYEALHHVRRLYAPMRDAMLRPTATLRRVMSARSGDVGDESDAPPAFADEIAANPKLVAFLERQFNAPQLAAIKCAAAHTAAKAQNNRRNANVGDDDFPFTLVQGPPGTGKTHTVWGVLNVLHFVLYQRYFQHLHRAIDLGTARAAGDRAFVAHVEDAGEREWLEKGGDSFFPRVATMKTRPVANALVQETCLSPRARSRARSPIAARLCARCFRTSAARRAWRRGSGTASRNQKFWYARRPTRRSITFSNAS